MGLAPEHPLVEKVRTPEQRSAVEAYRAAAVKKSELERTQLEKEKTGVFTGGHAVNPVNNEKIPIWVADYVMMGYGTGAIMAVPAHDTRDFDFAKKFELPIHYVVAEVFDESAPAEKSPAAMKMREMVDGSRAIRLVRSTDGKRTGVWREDTVFTGDGISFNSDFITGFPTPEAKKKITAWLQE